MGKALQIRVSAVTWNEDLLEELWPRLTELAFSLPMQHKKHGVLEMVHALEDGLSFMPWSEARKTIMGPGIREAARLKAELEEALSCWQAREANSLSDKLEDVLSDLEKSFVA